MTTRRGFLLGAAGLSAMAAAGGMYAVRADAGAAAGAFEVTKTEEEWRAALTGDQFAVLREEATEPPFSSPLNDEKRAGTFNCAGCGNPLYASEHKYDSGTGWPSFWRPIGEDAVGYKRDWKLLYPRQEVHCARCGGHQGHVFDDGPPPTGKRHCINGIAMTFEPSTGAAG
jgi:peptide-methionine (R)-S-oxide reductase